MRIHEGDGFTVDVLDGGVVRLDGGAMFGVVPKPLWSRRIPADDRNRIPLAMRCLLIRTPEATLLVDSGIGDKEGDKFRRIYGIENEGSPTRLQDSLREAGSSPSEVDVVLSTHLHFDHAGGNTVREEGGALRPAFPNARYVARRGEWEFAHRENERIQASYIADNFDPLRDAGCLELVDGDAEVIPGVRTIRTPGHTPHHQSVLVEAGGRTICYLADVVPTRAHLPLPWIMGYDVEPLVTLEAKRELLTRAGREGWTLVFEHDPEVAAGRAVAPDEGGEGCELSDPVEHVPAALRAGGGSR